MGGVLIVISLVETAGFGCKPISGKNNMHDVFCMQNKKEQ
jgi:hypothetical protein